MKLRENRDKYCRHLVEKDIHFHPFLFPLYIFLTITLKNLIGILVSKDNFSQR